MTQGSERLPIAARVLLTLVRGPGAEFVRGDIEERYRGERDRGRPGLRRWLIGDVLRTLVAWWAPPAVLRRRRRTGRGHRKRGGVGRMVVGLETLSGDLRQALRSLRRRPAFTLSVVLTLGVGIGATTTIYGVVDAIIVRPLPYADADQLVVLGNTFPGREWNDAVPELQHLAGVSLRNFEDWRRRAGSFEDIAAVEVSSGLLPDRGSGPELAPLAMVTPRFFDLLRVAPAHGRVFIDDDFAGRSGAVVVLSHRSWSERFGADPAVIGRAVETLGTSYTIVGVLPADFRPPEHLGGLQIEFWTPLDASHPRYSSRGRRSLWVFGRLRPNVELDVARREIDAIQAALADEFPDGNVYPNGDRLGAGVNPLHADTVGGSRRVLVMFLAASVVLLVVAGLNAANLLLVRGLDRAGELGLRRALGAGRGRLVRGLMLESLGLAVAGGVLGTGLAYGGVGLFLAWAPSSLPRLEEVSVNLRILVMCGIVSILIGGLMGLAPAVRLTGRDLASPIRRLSATATGARGSSRGGLVTVQLALAVMMSVGAGLLLNSFLRLRTVDPGFQANDLTAFSLPLKRPDAPRGEEVWEAWDRLLREVRGVPGLDGVAAASNLPFESPNWAPWVLLPGEADDHRRSGIAGYVVTPGFFSVMGARLIAGRDLAVTDGPEAASVVIVNRAFVREHLDGRDPIGLTLRFRDDGDTIRELEVVGVVDDVVQTRAEDGKQPAVYVPYTQAVWPMAEVVVRSGRALETLAPELREAAARFSRYVPVRRLSTMTARMGSARTEPRFRAMLIVAFAVVTVSLAAIGLYGTLAHAVGRRTRELGIRMALGADRSGIYSLVVRYAAGITGLGLLVGLAGAASLTRYLQSFLFGVESLDPVTFGMAAALLLIVAVLATLAPALRATRVDVVGSLRSE